MFWVDAELAYPHFLLAHLEQLLRNRERFHANVGLFSGFGPLPIKPWSTSFVMRKQTNQPQDFVIANMGFDRNFKSLTTNKSIC